MEMEISFPGGARVEARFDQYIVSTDQPPQGGGEGSAPTPFSLFLASLGTCAGIYVLEFLRHRGLPWQGVTLTQRTRSHPKTGMVEEVEVDIQLPAGIPEEYLPAIIRSAELCKVKKHLEQPPKITVHTSRQ
jgi:ribosomal protein S12 methylthiotransferase accessory factor